MLGSGNILIALGTLLVMLAAQVGVARCQTFEVPGFAVDSHVSGLQQPTSFVLLPATVFKPVSVMPETRSGASGERRIDLGLELLVCEKQTGRVIHVGDGLILGTALNLTVNSSSERGLLGIALHPQFATNHHVYVYYTRSSNGLDVLDHRVERYTWNGSTLTSPTTILTLPATPGPNHDGGVILFGADQKLYVVIGDLNRNGQLENFPLGDPPDDTAVILRINDDGSAPADNPFFALGNNMQKVFAYGVRNSFGMDFDPVTGDLWDTENGPNSYDEINRVEAGFNSGWEQIMGPDARDPQGLGDLWMAPGAHYSDPEFSWAQTIGVTSLHFIRSAILGSLWQDRCLVGDNNTGSLYVFELDGSRTALVMPEPGLLDLVADSAGERNAFRVGSGFGVVTDIDTGPDGVYVCSLTRGSLFRISRTPTAGIGTEPGGASRIEITPNPSRGVTLLRLHGSQRKGDVTSRIYTPSGKLVRTLSGPATGMQWDGLDGGGRTVAAGVYLVRFEIPEVMNVQAKIIRMR